MIRNCCDEDIPVIETIINAAAQKYRSAIPADCWHEPYMTITDLKAEITAGVSFSAWEDDGSVVGVMGIQKVKDATLIRHAYVLPGNQGRGIGGALLDAFIEQSEGKL